MEIARMNYYFTGILILAMTFLALCVGPAYPRNEYLNEYGVRCGEMEFRVEDRNNTQDYHTYNSSDCLLYTSPSPRDATLSRMPSSA